MADPPKPPPSQHRFKTRAGIQRKSAEERAAFIQAEAARQANQALPPPSLTPQRTGQRNPPGTAQRDVRHKNQNIGSVFGSSGAGTGPRTKNNAAVAGTEELVQKAANEGGARNEESEKRKGPDDLGSEEKPAPATHKTAARRAKSTAKKDGIVYVSDNEVEGMEGKPIDIEDIDRISISSKDDSDADKNDRNDDDDTAVVTSGRSRWRRANRKATPSRGLRPVRAARDPFSRGEEDQDQPGMKVKVKRKAKGVAKSQAELGGDPMDLDEIVDEDDEAAIAVAPKDSMLEEKGTGVRRKTTGKDSHTLHETIEERSERLRYATESRDLRDELLSHSRQTDPSDCPLYLFQFPPLIPMLVRSSDHNQVTTVKTESPTLPVRPEDDEAVASAAAASGATAPPSDEPPKLLTAANMRSGSGSGSRPTSMDNPNPSQALLPPGRAGTMHVHRSGKVTLEWGCSSSSLTTTTTIFSPPQSTTTTNMQLHMGSDLDFLQDVVYLTTTTTTTSGSTSKNTLETQQQQQQQQQPQGGKEEEEGGGGEEEEEEGERETRKAYALGQVSGKIVVVPDWVRLFE
jgi:hypothetical protein